jgi:hypothetical protein
VLLEETMLSPLKVFLLLQETTLSPFMVLFLLQETMLSPLRQESHSHQHHEEMKLPTRQTTSYST